MGNYVLGFFMKHGVFHTPVARCSLFVLKVLLNTNQLTN